MGKKLGKYLALALVFSLAALAIVRLGHLRESPQASRYQSRIMMDTVVSIRIYQGDSGRIDAATQSAFAEMKRLEGLLSVWSPESDISRINQFAGLNLVAVNASTWEAIRQTQELSSLTRGTFDITIGAVMQLWDFQSPSPLVPAPEAIAIRLPLVGPDQVLLDSLNMRIGLRQHGAALDLGGAAKGFAVDRALQVLREWGVQSAVVDAGGDVGLLGRKSPGDPWKIGIKHPQDPGAIVEVIDVDSGAVATSGNYERYFDLDGIRYHHILDPATGRPAPDVISVTILAPTALEADVLSTAVFVLGPDRGLALIEQLGQVEGVIYLEGSEGMRRISSTGFPAKKDS